MVVESIGKQPDLGGARLISMATVRNESIDLEFRTRSGQRWFLTMNGVQRMRAEDFGVQNLVDEVVIQRGSDMDEAIVEDLFGQAHVLQARKWLLSTKSENYALVLVIPRLGCSVTALCGQVSFRRSAKR